MDLEVAKKTMVELEREAHKLSEQQNMRQALIVASNTKMLDSITEAIAKVRARCVCVGTAVCMNCMCVCVFVCVHWFWSTKLTFCWTNGKTYHM